MTGPASRGDSFRGRTALVTGGGSGIGAAIAIELARRGAEVALVGRTERRLEEVADRIRSSDGVARTFPCDVRDRARVDEVVAETAAGDGPIHHLVNCAAGNFRSRPEDLSHNAWRSVVDIVLNGSWNMTQAVGRIMIDQPTSLSVLSIGTTMATRGSPTTVHSASAKAGVLTMTRSLAAAWGSRGVRLNVLTPGITADTQGHVALQDSADAQSAALTTIPAGRFTTPPEVARVAAFLLSDEAAYITGAELVMDGGRSLGTF